MRGSLSIGAATAGLALLSAASLGSQQPVQTSQPHSNSPSLHYSSLRDATARQANTPLFHSSDAAILVTNTNDNGPGSLRQALVDAQNGDTIQFDPALNGQTITLTSGELVVDKNIIISGPGPTLLTVSELYIPKFLYRIFHLRPSHIVTIEGLTITGGYANGSVGGGILNDHATLNINNCTITANHTDRQGGGI